MTILGFALLAHGIPPEPVCMNFKQLDFCFRLERNCVRQTEKDVLLDSLFKTRDKLQNKVPFFSLSHYLSHFASLFFSVPPLYEF
jgi:hypothetical protein